MGRKKELEKIMIDYMRWMYRLDFCMPRYAILKKIGLEKLKKMRNSVEVWLEDKRKKGNDLIKKCWIEKEKAEKKELYSRKKEFFQ